MTLHSLPETAETVDSTEVSGAAVLEPVAPIPDVCAGSRRERSPSPVPAPSVPPSKRPRRHLSREEDDDVEIIVSPSTADAYMCESVPVFVENSATRTPGPAPRMGAVSPGGNLLVVDDVYRRPSPGLDRPMAAASDEQRVITLTDSGLLQLFRAHGVDLDRRGMFLFLRCPSYVVFLCVLPFRFSLCASHSFLCWCAVRWELQSLPVLACAFQGAFFCYNVCSLRFLWGYRFIYASRLVPTRCVVDACCTPAAHSESSFSIPCRRSLYQLLSSALTICLCSFVGPFAHSPRPHH